MGYIRHDAVIGIVDNFSENKGVPAAINKLKKKMKGDQRGVPNCIHGPTLGVNGTNSWCFLPDGSKEGWDTSEATDEYRDEFKSIIRDAKYGQLIHVQFAGDDGKSLILDSTDERKGW